MKYLPGLIVGPLSGSSGSSTASRNRNGHYLRVRGNPVNPGTPKQTDYRAQFAANSQAWRELTDQLRLAWDSLGAQINRTNSLGATYSLTGPQAYSMINANRQTYGNAVDSTPPAFNEPAGPASLTLTADQTGGTISLGYTPTPLSADVKLQIWASPVVSAGVRFMSRSRMKQIMVTAAAAASPANLKSAYEAVFGTQLLEGQKLFVGVRAIDSLGWASPFVLISTIIESS